METYTTINRSHPGYRLVERGLNTGHCMDAEAGFIFVGIRCHYYESGPFSCSYVAYGAMRHSRAEPALAKAGAGIHLPREGGEDGLKRDVDVTGDFAQDLTSALQTLCRGYPSAKIGAN